LIFNRRLLISFDWLWFLAILLLAGAGVAAIWSTTEGTSLNSYFGRQLIYLCLALVTFAALIYFDYHIYSDFITFIYVTGMAVLVFVLIFGHTSHGNKSWIDMGGFRFQPSELMKVVAVIALSKYYSENDREQLELQELFIGGLIVFAPMLLVILQGDLGTAVTFIPVYAGLSFLAGIKKKHIVALLLAAAISAPLGWLMLKDYQRGRIQTVFNPSNDPRRLGYQTIQSKIAIGSGRFLGKGVKQGSQGQLGFLPARHTDFVFAVWAEERGFVGSMAVLLLFLFVSLRLLAAARDAKDKVGTMIIVGVLSVFIFHILINVGMVLGLLPIAGIPLPLVSAGGSSLISSFAAMGLCMNINMRRYVN
jgi:rod shape determining protein RodA